MLLKGFSCPLKFYLFPVFDYLFYLQLILNSAVSLFHFVAMAT